MTISAKKIQIIHVAKGKLRLDDDSYRAILTREAGVTSSLDLDDAGYAAVMKQFKRLGFVPSPAATRPAFGIRPGMASPRQVELIRDLWQEFRGAEGNDLTLGRWLERTFHISSIRFLGYDDAHKAIGALKQMKDRKLDQGSREDGAENGAAASAKPGKRRHNPAPVPHAVVGQGSDGGPPTAS